MALSLSEAQLKQVSAQLFLFQDPNLLRLSKPSAIGVDLTSRMTPVATDAQFKDLSFGVVDFTSDLMAPNIWLHNEEVPWQMASTGKIALLLAAAQLRDDVRRVKDTGLISAAADFDELFATIWNRSSATWVKEIATTKGAPRISTVFDLSLTPIDFAGADKPLDATRKAELASAVFHQKWKKISDCTFWERMWMTGGQSDNVAACSLGSEIGMAYVKAVQRAYGLFDPPGMKMLLCAAYGSPPKKTPLTRAAGAPTYRRVINKESHPVTNPLGPKKPIWSTQGSSVTALIAYMMALMQNKLVSSDPGDAKDACSTIRSCLGGGPGTLTTWIHVGVQEIATVSQAHTKIGILGSLNCDFSYLETTGKKYGVAAMGILPVKVGTRSYNTAQREKELGKAIHVALTA